MSNEQTWTITDIDGRNPRIVTLSQFRAEMDARKEAAKPIAAGWRRGDIAGVETAQTAFRAQFSKVTA
jgi:hypothetical protein